MEVSGLHSGSSANIRYPKIHLTKIGQPREYLGRLLGSLLKTGLPLMKNVIKPPAKRVF